MDTYDGGSESGEEGSGSVLGDGGSEGGDHSLKVKGVDEGKVQAVVSHERANGRAQR